MTIRKALSRAALAAMLALPAVAAQAATIAQSGFAGGDDGWRNGEFTGLSGTGGVTHDAANGWITTGDVFAYNAFVAPGAYLGNQSGAFGGTISFGLSDSDNDFPTIYSPLTLISGATTYYAVPSVVPSTTNTALTQFSITLTGANFRTGDQGTGAVVTDAQLLAVLGSLSRVGINADWNTGGDFVTLDNVRLCDARGCDMVGVIPEPSTWALLILGFGAVGGAMRRRPARVSLA